MEDEAEAAKLHNGNGNVKSNGHTKADPLYDLAKNKLNGATTFDVARQRVLISNN